MENRTLFGNYRIEEYLSEGGMGRVMRGVQLSLQRPVAIKELSTALANNPHFIARFEKEAIGLGAMNSENIVGALDFGREGDSYFIVMEYVSGGDLQSVLAEHLILSPNDALTIFEQTARGLSYAHQRSILHRDIKPANIMLTSDGTVKVTDFGLCRFVDDPGELTMAGAVMGTPRYMSPEQAMGLPLDERSDLYSLGLVLYEMLTGLYAINGETQRELLENQIRGIGPDFGRMPRKVHKGIVKMLKELVAHKPKDRYASLGEVLAEIRTFRRKQKEFYDQSDLSGLLSGEPTTILSPERLQEKLAAIRRTIDTRVDSSTPPQEKVYSLSTLDISAFVPGYSPCFIQPQEWARIQSVVRDRHSILVTGRPGSGKTRSLFEALHQLREGFDTWQVIILNPENEQELTVQRDRIIVIWDDMDAYRSRWNPHRMITEIKAAVKEFVLLGTVRSGSSFKQLEGRRPEWIYLFDERITISDLDDSSARELAGQVDGNLLLFDGTPGSVVLDLTAVKSVYRQMPREQKDILHVFKILWLLSIRRPDRDMISLIADELFDITLGRSELRDVLKELDVFIVRDSGGYGFHYDIYPAKVITDFEDVDLDEELDDLFDIFAENNMAAPLIGITRFYWDKKQLRNMLRVAEYNYSRWPDNHLILSHLALARKQNGDIKGGLELIDRALKIDPGNFEYHINRGAFRTAVHDFSGAIEDMDFCLRLMPDSVDAINNRAIANRNLGNHEKALEDYNLAISLRPHLPELYNNRAVERFTLKDVQGGIDDMKKSIEIDPTYGKSYTNLGVIYRMLGNDDEARRYFEKAVEVDPTDANSLYNHAHVMKTIPDYKRALEDYSRAYELFPDSENKAKTLSACAIIYAITEQDKRAFDALEAADRHSRPAALYNRLCTLSVMGKRDSTRLDEAFDVLREVVAAGRVSRDWLRKDDDIAFLRKDSRFDQIVG